MIIKKALFLTAAIALTAGCGGSNVASGVRGNAVQNGNAVQDGNGNGFIDDRDKQRYRTVKIGSQVWMAENLNYKTEDSYCYDDDESNCVKYGRLYSSRRLDSGNLYNGQTLCPSGWHVPNRSEWDELESAAGGKGVAGKNLKSASGWSDHYEYEYEYVDYGGRKAIDSSIVKSGNGADAYGFSALPGGNIEAGEGFDDIGHRGYWYSANDIVAHGVYYRCMTHSDSLIEGRIDEYVGFSVRCVLDRSGSGGGSISPIVYGSLHDPRNDQKYRTVTIGGKTWMAENLNYKADTSWCYDFDESNCIKYGRLYDWNTAMNICPSGWHLPDTADFERLIDAAGGLEVAGETLKSREGWESNGTDRYGFSALPGGGYDTDYRGGREFKFIGIFGQWWSTTAFKHSESSDAHLLRMYYDDGHDHIEVRAYDRKSYGFSVRCMMD